MKFASRFVASTLAGLLCIVAGAETRASESWSTQTMKPRMAASLNAGLKHIVSFFVNADGVCKLTVMIANSVGEDAGTEATQLQISVEPGRSARVATAEGKALRFICLGRAEAMSATTLSRLAMQPPSD